MSTTFRWPPRFTSDGDMETISGPPEAEARMRFQLLTVLHEILYTEDGSNAKYKVFEQNDQALQVQLADSMKQMFARQFAAEFEIQKVEFKFNKTEFDSATNVENFIRAIVRYKDKTTQDVNTVTVNIPLPGG